MVVSSSTFMLICFISFTSLLSIKLIATKLSPGGRFNDVNGMFNDEIE